MFIRYQAKIDIAILLNLRVQKNFPRVCASIFLALPANR